MAVSPPSGHASHRPGATTRPTVPAALRTRPSPAVPDLRAAGDALVRVGVTGVTDATETNDAATAALLTGAGVPQRLVVMNTADNPHKLVVHDDEVPDPDELAARIRAE